MLLIGLVVVESSIVKLVENTVARILVFGVSVEVDDVDNGLWILDLFFG